MTNKGDFNVYIYIPVAYNEIIKKRSEYCYDILFKLINKQFNIYNVKSNQNDLFTKQNNELNKEEILKHIYYQIDNLNIDKKVQYDEKKDIEDSLHITIVGSVQIKRYMISSFINKVKEEMKNQNCFYLFFKKDVDLYKSQKNTKYFCSYSVNSEQQKLHLDPLIKKINKILNQFGLNNNYVNRICHVSLAYTDTSLETILEKNKLNVNDMFWPNINEIIIDNNSNHNTDDFYIYVNCIHVCIGNKLYKIHFKNFSNSNLLESDDFYVSSTDES
ncbi:U6 snRNA phosphodiesterase, putative [Plasmodium gallinaceum]|uniref:U6 snRNA phosphodiesterase 1 n=1 Tax=Plasmodium gallinaceum TaxID=5849 RepID=A0A1J1GRJ3_PLAGA|nr:U6 snRNA phosphodiesterase, putative [Plasmodium gallinaceum]CRG95151.1 U6 snRNA phosphodiesterase, putative [Plasmodium gallinaceum]